MSFDKLSIEEQSVEKLSVEKLSVEEQSVEVLLVEDHVAFKTSELMIYVGPSTVIKYFSAGNLSC